MDKTPPMKDLEKGEEHEKVIDGNARDRNQGRASTPGSQLHSTDDGKRIITEDECWDILGYSWPAWKKWMLLSSVFAVQVSMNFNTSVYPSSIKQMAKYFGVSEQAARVGQCLFLVLYAFGCELWAPWSEEFGRWPILQ